MGSEHLVTSGCDYHKGRANLLSNGCRQWAGLSQDCLLEKLAMMAAIWEDVESSVAFA
jgi:hypothetical protein